MWLTLRENKAGDWFSSDKKFDSLYPEVVRSASRRHWTPLNIAYKAACFLVSQKGTRILDIGSGVGKFCISAAHYQPEGIFVGIEQRRYLVEHANRACEIISGDNVSFLCGNFTQVDFRNYDHFYFYNSFYENLIGTDRIDDNLEYSVELYNYYNRYLFQQLDKQPPGTRIATYHSLEDELPRSYRLVHSESDSLLKFWVRQ